MKCPRAWKCVGIRARRCAPVSGNRSVPKAAGFARSLGNMAVLGRAAGAQTDPTAPVSAVWSTFPIASAHRIGSRSAVAALPWVAEFRDPMWQGDYPPDPAVNRAWLEFEGAVSTSQRCRRNYAGRRCSLSRSYPAFDSSRIELIENGYDEETFRRAEQQMAPARGADVTRGVPFHASA